MHGAGSPQAQRVQIARQSQLDYKKKLAIRLADGGKDAANSNDEDFEDYMSRVFRVETSP